MTSSTTSMNQYSETTDIDFARSCVTRGLDKRTGKGRKAVLSCSDALLSRVALVLARGACLPWPILPGLTSLEPALQQKDKLEVPTMEACVSSVRAVQRGRVGSLSRTKD